MKISDRVIIVFFTVLLSILSISIAFAEVFTVPLPPVEVIDEADYSNVITFSGSEFQFLSATGEPSIPYVNYKILLPRGTVPESISISLENVEEELITGPFDISPVSPAATWNGEEDVHLWPEDRNLIEGRDMAVYTKDEVFPAEHIYGIRTGQIRGENVIDVPIAVYRYNPVQGNLFKLREAEIVVNYESSGEVLSSSGMDSITESIVKKSVINFPDGPSSLSSSSEPQAGTGYAIITTSNIVNSSSQLSNFMEWKTSRGFSVQLVTESGWGGGTGNTAAERIRTWLKNNYQSRSLKYVLLLGNPDPSTGDVPMKMLWPRNNASSYTEDGYRQSPSDLYYADLTGNWDKDGDGRYGEGDHDMVTGGIDTNWEVFIGRIPYYGSISDLDSILLKIMTYENTAQDESGWRENVLLPMKPSDDRTPGYHLGEAVKNDILPAGWGYTRVYDENYGVSPEKTPCTTTNVTNSWNQSNFGAVLWWTHGWYTTASDVMDLSHVATLDNSHPAVVFQGSCMNAHPETSNNLSYSLLKNGAIASIGATRYSWYSPGQTSFSGSVTSAGMTYDFSKRIIEYEEDFGTALFLVKQGRYPTSTWWMNFTDFNLYGDPSVSLGASSSTEQYLLSGRITTEDGVLSGVTVTASGNFLTRQTYTSSTGSYSLEVPEGDYTISVSKSNYVFNPSSSSVTVEGTNVSNQDFFALPSSSTTTTTSTTTASGGGGGGGCNASSLPWGAILLLIPLAGLLIPSSSIKK